MVDVGDVDRRAFHFKEALATEMMDGHDPDESVSRMELLMSD